MRESNQCFRKPVTKFIPSWLALEREAASGHGDGVCRTNMVRSVK